MIIAIRVDASIQIGSGHVMRCLTLADELKRNGANVHFICREHPGNMCAFIEARGYMVYPLTSDGNESTIDLSQDLPKHADWLGTSWERDAHETIKVIQEKVTGCDSLIVDHYAIDYRWEALFKPFVSKIMVIDDLADRRHGCDLLLDQNYYHNKEERYLDKVPPYCQLLIGPHYAMLREEFKELREQVKPRTGITKRILVFFGGVDVNNYTAHAIKALSRNVRFRLHVDVVIGAQNTHRQCIEIACAKHGFTCHIQTSHMAELMLAADLAIGAGGSTTLERISMGLPSIVFAIAENQRESVKSLSDDRYIYSLDSDLFTLEMSIANRILDSSIYALSAMSLKCMDLVDCLGADRVAEVIL